MLVSLSWPAHVAPHTALRGSLSSALYHSRPGKWRGGARGRCGAAGHRTFLQSWGLELWDVKSSALTAGLVDGAEVPEDDAALLVSILSGAFSAEPEAEEAARASVQQRASRRDAYVI